MQCINNLFSKTVSIRIRNYQASQDVSVFMFTIILVAVLRHKVTLLKLEIYLPTLQKLRTNFGLHKFRIDILRNVRMHTYVVLFT